MSHSTTEDRPDRIEARVEEAVRVAAEPQAVPVNMYETEEALVLLAALPGVMADDVRVEVEPHRVRITAEMRTPAPKDYLLHEWHYGPYERVVEIPEGFGGPAAATFGNGQLALRVTRGEGGPSGRLAVGAVAP